MPRFPYHEIPSLLASLQYSRTSSFLSFPDLAHAYIPIPLTDGKRYFRILALSYPVKFSISFSFPFLPPFLFFVALHCVRA